MFQSLRSDIVNGSLKPGARLRFIELQARYGIGTSPIREALSRLAADRLVIQEVNRGFSVPPLSLEDFADITELRLTLERGAIRASIARGDEAWEEELVLAHHRLRRLGRPESDPEDETHPGRVGTPASRLPHGPDRRLRLAVDAAFLRRALRPVRPLPAPGRA